MAPAHGPVFTQSRLWAPSPSRPASTELSWSSHSSVEWSRASSRSSSSARVTARSHSRVRSPARSQPSSSSVVLASVESCSPLDAVPAARSTGMSYCRRSPAAPSCTRSHSPVLGGSHSRSRSRSRTHRSPCGGGAGMSWGLMCACTQGVLSAVEAVQVSFKDVFQERICFS